MPAPLFMPKNAEGAADGVKTAGKAETAAGRSFDRRQARLLLSTAAGLFRFLGPFPPPYLPRRGIRIAGPTVSLSKKPSGAQAAGR